MSYAILQVDVAPTADQLKRAVKSLKTLTEADAVKMAVEARGILLKNLSLEDSAALQRALQSEGVPTEMIEANQLPKLPDAKFVRRMELRPEALLVNDPVGRAVPLPWQQIALLSAGAVRHFDLSQTRREETVRTYDPVYDSGVVTTESTNGYYRTTVIPVEPTIVTQGATPETGPLPAPEHLPAVASDSELRATSDRDGGDPLHLPEPVEEDTGEEKVERHQPRCQRAAPRRARQRGLRQQSSVVR